MKYLGTVKNKLRGKFIVPPIHSLKYGHLHHADTQCSILRSAIWFELDCMESDPAPCDMERSLRTLDPGSFPHTRERVWEQDYITSAPIYHTSFVQNATRNMQPATLHLPTTCTKLTEELHKNFVIRFFMKIHKFFMTFPIPVQKTSTVIIRILFKLKNNYVVTLG